MAQGFFLGEEGAGGGCDRQKKGGSFCWKLSDRARPWQYNHLV